MKRWIRGSETIKGVERITIDFYPDLSILETDVETDVVAAKRKHQRTSNIRQVFKNKAHQVVNDITDYLNSKGVKILNTSISSREGSDSTYYDVDISILTNKGTRYLFFRVSDHKEGANFFGSRKDYHRRKAAKYEGRELTADEADKLFEYCRITVVSTRYPNYDKALNGVKDIIDDYLKYYGVD